MHGYSVEDFDFLFSIISISGAVQAHKLFFFKYSEGVQDEKKTLPPLLHICSVIWEYLIWRYRWKENKQNGWNLERRIVTDSV